MLKITLAQLNPTVGDMDGNIDQMVAAARQAQAEGAQLVVFAELSLTAYYPGDLLDEPDFLARVDAGIARLLQESQQLLVVLQADGAVVQHQQAVVQRLAHAPIR